MDAILLKTSGSKEMLAKISRRRDALRKAINTKDTANLSKIIEEIDHEMEKAGLECKDEILKTLPS